MFVPATATSIRGGPTLGHPLPAVESQAEEADRSPINILPNADVAILLVARTHFVDPSEVDVLLQLHRVFVVPEFHRLEHDSMRGVSKRGKGLMDLPGNRRREEFPVQRGMSRPHPSPDDAAKIELIDAPYLTVSTYKGCRTQLTVWAEGTSRKHFRSSLARESSMD
jgi:hypothetical protein